MKAAAGIDGKRIVLATKLEGGDSFEEMLDMCKAVGGGRFRSSDKMWHYPLSVETCHGLRRVFGDRLKVKKSLAAWYLEGAAARAAQTALSAEADAELAYLPTRYPALSATLRPDQRVGARWIAEGYRDGGLVADKPGLGKTIETIAGLMEREDNEGEYLILCPRLSVKVVWGKELAKWLPGVSVHLCRGTRAQREKVLREFDADPSPIKFIIAVMETLRIKETPIPGNSKKKQFAGYEYPQFFNRTWKAVVVDESHKAFGSLTVAKGTLHGKGLKRLKTEYKVAMTATPFGKGGRIQGLFGTLHWLWPDEFTSFWRWAGEYFIIDEEDVFTRGCRGVPTTTKKVGDLRGGLSGEEFLKTLGPRILRRTKEEVLAWLPPKQYIDVICEMPTEQVRQYQQLVDDAEFSTEGGMISADGVLAILTRSKQLANGCLMAEGEGDERRVRFTGVSGKIEMLMQKLAERGIVGDDGEDDTKVLIASQFNEFLDAIMGQLDEEGVQYLSMRGSTSDKKRDEMMEAFQEAGGPRVFIINSKAGGVSVTLDAADELFQMDEMYDPGDNEQLEDRIHRASRNHQVRIYRFLSEGTIDERIHEDVEERAQWQHLVLDGRRGMDYARDLVRYRKPKEEVAA